MSDEDDLWQALRRFTPARLGLGRAGPALPTKALLEFGVAHAAARDAVHAPLDWPALELELKQHFALPVVRVASQANDRATYLRRPDLGRRLDQESRARLESLAPGAPCDLIFVLADGLSGAAISRHATAFLDSFLPDLKDIKIGPIVLAHNARVALGDEIGAILQARFIVVAIGERPGLSSPDSLGLYLTREPRLGRHDAERNCLSNIHGAGLSYAIAARKLLSLIEGARRLGATGTTLKDLTDGEGFVLTDAQTGAALAGPL